MGSQPPNTIARGRNLTGALCVGFCGLALAVFSGPYDIVMLYRSIEGSPGERDLYGEISNRGILAAALLPAFWYSRRATFRWLARVAAGDEERERLGLFDALTFLPLVLLLAPLLPVCGSRGHDGFLAPMLVLFLDCTACVLAGKGALFSALRAREPRAGRLSKTRPGRLALAAGACGLGAGAAAWRIGPSLFMIPPWDPRFSEVYWPRDGYVSLHLAAVLLLAFSLFVPLWTAALRWKRLGPSAAGAAILVVSGGLAWASLACLADAQRRFDDEVFAWRSVQKEGPVVEILDVSEVTTARGAPAFVRFVLDAGRGVVRGEVLGLAGNSDGFELAPAASGPDRNKVRISMGVMEEGWLWYRRDTAARFLVTREAESHPALLFSVDLDPRNRPADRRWASVTLDLVPGEPYVLKAFPLEGRSSNPFAAVSLNPVP